jgi:excisionase family DNA binding protein
LDAIRITTRGPHARIFISASFVPSFLVGYRKVYSGRREADVVMSSVIAKNQRPGKALPAASVADQQREINELIREAAEIQRLVEELLGRICTGNEMEGVHTVTVSDVAELLNISERQVYKLAAENRIPSFKIGGSVRFDPAAFAAWLRHKFEPSSVRLVGSARGARRVS